MEIDTRGECLLPLPKSCCVHSEPRVRWAEVGVDPTHVQPGLDAVLSPFQPLPDDPTATLSSAALPGDGYVQADTRGPRDYEEHLYVNTQGLDAPEPEDLVPPQPEDSPKKDLFDMRTLGPGWGAPAGWWGYSASSLGPGNPLCSL